jgi:hypothetical protein
MSDWKYDDDDMLTAGEVARIFRVNPKTVTRWARVGRIPDADGRPSVIRTPGGHIRIRAKTVRMIRDGQIQLEYAAPACTIPATPAVRTGAELISAGRTIGAH